MAASEKKIKEIGRSKSMPSNSQRRDTKSATLPANTRPAPSSSGESFFTKLKRCLRIGSKGRYNVNAIQAESLQVQQTSLQNTGQMEKVRGIVNRATSLRFNRREHNDKEDVILVHKGKMASGNGLFAKRSVSDTIPEDAEQMVPYIVNGGTPPDSRQPLEDEHDEAAGEDIDDMLEMDPGYETLDEIRKKVRLQAAAAAAKQSKKKTSEVTTNNVSKPVVAEVSKPSELGEDRDGCPPSENGMDSGITTPTTESPESGRDSQARSLTSSMFSDTAFTEESNQVDTIEPEEITTRGGTVYRLNSCPGEGLRKPQREGQRYSSDSVLTKSLILDDTDHDLYANPQILFRKQSKMGQKKSASVCTITVNGSEAAGDTLSHPIGLGEKSVSDSEIKPLRGSSVDSDTPAPPLPDRKYLDSDTGTIRAETDDEHSADNDCSTSTTISANQELSQSATHGSVTSIGSIREVCVESFHQVTPDLKIQSSSNESTSKHNHDSSQSNTESVTQNNTTSSKSDSCELSNDGRQPSSNSSSGRTASGESGSQSVSQSESQTMKSQGKIVMSSAVVDQAECGAQNTGLNLQNGESCDSTSSHIILEKDQSNLNSQAHGVDSDTCLDSGSINVERREKSQCESSDQSCVRDNVVVIKLHESTHEDCLTGDEGVSDESIARLEEKATMLQLGAHGKDSSRESLQATGCKSDSEGSRDSGEIVEGTEALPSHGGPELSSSGAGSEGPAAKARSRKSKKKEEPIHMTLAEVMNSKEVETEEVLEVDDDDYMSLAEDDEDNVQEEEIAGAAAAAAVRQSSQNSTAAAHRAFLESMRQLKDCGWYWGPLSYNEAMSKLINRPDGSFLVRDSSNENYILSLSFKSMGNVCHTRIEHNKGVFSFWSQPDSHGTSTIKEFIEQAVRFSHTGKFLYFLRPSGPGSPPIAIRLLYPVSRFCRVPSLQHNCRFLILRWVRRDHIDVLPVPEKVKNYLRENQYYVETLDED